MTVKKQKGLLELNIPTIELPPVSIEEPADRPAPDPVPAVLPGIALKGGIPYVAQVERKLGINVSPSILTSVPILRQVELGLGVVVEQVPPIEREVSAKIKSMAEYWLTTEIVKEVNLGIGVANQFGMIFATKYDGVGEALFYEGYKYDGEEGVLFYEGYKYDGVMTTTES